MNYIKVNHEKCTQCGLCVNVCRGVLGMGINGPEVVKELCINCGHCVAVCPKEALDHVNIPLINQIPLGEMPVLDADTAARFIRSRRSIRSYKETPVPREEIVKLLDIARFAPTACNSQGVVYHVIDKPDTLRSITAATIDWAEGEMKKSSPLSNSPWAHNTAAQIENYRQTGKDVVLRDAPCVVIAMADKSLMPLGRDNTHFSFSYAQIYAPAIGLATCWGGLFEYCATAGYQPILRLLNLPENVTITGALMVGYPQYQYKRLVDRDPLKVTWQ
jgi:Nitroreductase